MNRRVLRGARAMAVVAVLGNAVLIGTGAAPVTAAGTTGAVPTGCNREYGDWVRCTFSSGVTRFDIPAAVRRITISATGAPGASSSFTHVGGLGMTAMASVAVDPDQDLEITVGGATTAQSGYAHHGGLPGKAATGTPSGQPRAGRGGGASYVTVAGSNRLTAPIVLGAGGGGAGGGTDGRSGGDAQAPGFGESPGRPGQTGGAGATGATDGSADSGGDGAPATDATVSAGGGGGGGWFGGGGGGAGTAEQAAGSGGGGGSSYGPAGTHYFLSPLGPQVVLRWLDPPGPVPHVTRIDGNWTPAPTMYFSTDRRARFKCAVDSATFRPCTSPWRPARLAEGVHGLWITATDDAGRTSLNPSYVKYVVDTTPPGTSITSSPTSPTTKRTLPFTFHAAPSRDPAGFQCKVNNGTWTVCTSPFVLRNVRPGTYTVWIRAIDRAGNKDASPSTRTVRVR